MRLPPSILNKYLDRFDELIQEGERIYKVIKDIPTVKFSAPGEVIRPLTQQELEARQKLQGWYLNYLSLLDQIIPPRSVHRKLLDETESYYDASDKLNTYIYRLKGLKEDFQKGYLGDLGLEIEAAIVADYMGQAEQLLAEGQSGKYDYVPAAVLAGAVLEKSLRTLCDKQSPSISRVNNNGKPLTLTPLIDVLKKNNLFNELTAKQLRGWADIRNSAAHGHFDEFNRSQVDLMIQGINNFLATHMI
ncbi:DUF4145 domain-containing protein [Microcoleus vaginatus PCC 9802]|uniref:hypothetical protein n=1 Tax=Microcoleus vaginatus TaxID=119532 RepID=UPI00020D1D69|nr:hypothetical protein MicvaDRAFT_3407 [Microcoleus vaginatus FGP-2]UNU21567.1 DUF4145 domain-containing protein [Microcoleus vaginatus PCC 9802]